MFVFVFNSNDYGSKLFCKVPNSKSKFSSKQCWFNIGLVNNCLRSFSCFKISINHNKDVCIANRISRTIRYHRLPRPVRRHRPQQPLPWPAGRQHRLPEPRTHRHHRLPRSAGQHWRFYLRWPAWPGHRLPQRLRRLPG